MNSVLKLSALSLLITTGPAAVASDYNVTETKLSEGIVYVYDYKNIKMHVYNTQDPLGDVLYAFETDKGLVLLESTVLKKNVECFNDYLKGLNKNLKGELLSYHPNGYTTYKSTVYATDGAVKSWNEGSVKSLTEQFVSGFGEDKVASDMPETANKIKIGDELSLAGINFKILDGKTTEGHFDVAIPEINAVYTHMMGSDVHNILPSKEAIESEILRFEKIQNDNYDLIMTSHYMPETQAGVKQKLVYLKKVKELADKSLNRQEFISAVKEAFPSYKGENYLEMSASMLFKK